MKTSMEMYIQNALLHQQERFKLIEATSIAVEVIKQSLPQDKATELETFIDRLVENNISLAAFQELQIISTNFSTANSNRGRNSDLHLVADNDFLSTLYSKLANIYAKFLDTERLCKQINEAIRTVPTDSTLNMDEKLNHLLAHEQMRSVNDVAMKETLRQLNYVAKLIENKSQKLVKEHHLKVITQIIVFTDK